MDKVIRDIRRRIELNEPLREVNIGQIVRGDANADRFILELVENGQPVNLDDYSVSGFFINAIGLDVPITGDITGNVLTATLGEGCYDVRGMAGGFIRVANGDATVIKTVLRFTTDVLSDGTGNIYDPDMVIGSVAELLAKIAEMEDATRDARLATQEVRDALGDEGNAQIAAIRAEGEKQVGDTNAAGAAQITAIEETGAATLETIPEDYTQLANDVSSLKIHIGDLKSAFDSFLLILPTASSIWEQGSIALASGSNASSNARIRTVSRVSINVEKIKSADGYYMVIYGYDSNTDYIGIWNGTTFNKPSTFADNNKFTEIDLSELPAATFRIVLSKASGENVVPSEGVNVAYVKNTDTTLTMENKSADAKTVGDYFGEIQNNNQKMANIIAGNDNEIVFFELDGKTKLIQGIALNGSGAETNSDTSYATDFIELLSENEKVYSEITLTDYSTAYYHYACFYDSNKAFLERTGGSRTKKIETSVPAGTKYVRVSLTYVGIANTTGYSLKVWQDTASKGSPINKWYVLGDSISAGYYSMTRAMADAQGLTFAYVSPVTTDSGEETGSVWDASLGHNYWGYANKWFMKRNLVGKAYPGQGYLRTASNSQNGIDVVKNNDFSDAGLIAVAWGFNDWHYNQNRGDHTLISDSVPYPTENYDTTQITTVNQAIWYCLGELIRKAPNAKIVVQTPMNGWAYGGDWSTNWGIGYAMSNSGTLANIHDDIVYWANYYGLQVLEMTYNNSVVNRRNIKDTIIDGSHPSDAAHQQLGRHVAIALQYC